MRRLLVVAGVGACACAMASTAWSSETATYTYDALGRLVKTSKSQTSSGGANTQICYDAAGNRTRYAATVTSASPTACDGTTGGTTSGGSTPPSFSINDAGEMEGLTLTFTVTKTASTPSSFSVNYATANGSANILDYTAKSGTLTFGSSETSKTITITLKTDNNVESDEYFYVNLSAPTGGATIYDSQGKGTIYDDGMGGEPMCGGVPC